LDDAHFIHIDESPEIDGFSGLGLFAVAIWYTSR